LAGGDDRLAGQQGRANQIDGRVAAGERFDDDIDIAREQVVEAFRPIDAGERFGLAGALVAGASVGDMRETELRDGVRTGEAAGDGRTDGAEAKNADATAGIAITRA